LVRVKGAEDSEGHWEFLPGNKNGLVFQVPLTAVAVEALAARLEVLQLERQYAGEAWEECGLMWPTKSGAPMHARTLQKHLAGICRDQGLPHLTPHHLFRRGASTLMAAEGVPAKVRAAILGHTRVATTEDIYTDVLDPDLRAAVDTLGRILRGP